MTHDDLKGRVEGWQQAGMWTLISPHGYVWAVPTAQQAAAIAEQQERSPLRMFPIHDLHQEASE